MNREDKIAKIRALRSGAGAPQALTREQKIAKVRELRAQSAAPEQVDAGFLSQAGDAVLGGVQAAGEFLDTYTGAPARAAIGAAQQGENPLTAGYEQFGEDPSQAPTGKELAQTAGVPDNALSELVPGLFTDDDKEAEEWLKFKKGGAADITASGAAGLGLDIAADPTNLIPGKAMAAGFKGVKKGVGAVGKGLRKAGQMGADVATKATIKGGKTLTGMPEAVIENYIKKRKAIDKVIAKYGDDVTGAADELRKSMNNSISLKIGQLSDEIGEIIDGAADGVKVKASAITDALDNVRTGIDVDLNPEAIDEISELIDRVGKKGEFLGAKEVNQVKRFLQDRAKASYLKPGQMIGSSKVAQKAAKSGARVARKLEGKIAPETVARNAKLQQIHQMNKQINPNILKEGKNPTAIISAGTGANQANINQLKKLGELTDKDFVSQATDLATQKSFANAPLLPVDTTGKTAARIAVGYGTGALIGGPVGGALGAALTSPYVLKKAIQAGDFSTDLAKALADTTGAVTDSVLKRAIKASGTKRGRAMIRAFEKTGKVSAIEGYKKEKNKGKAKWAKEGLNKIKRSLGDDMAAKYEVHRSSKKGRDILSQISTLKPGSAAFKAALKKLDKLEGNKR